MSSVNSQKRAASSPLSAASFAANGQQPAVSSLLPGAGTQHPAVIIQRSAASSQQPSTGAGTQHPAASSQQPVASSKQQAANYMEPGHSSQQSATSGQQPAASGLLPGAGTQHPGARSFLSQTAVSSQQQLAFCPKLEPSSQQPAVSIQRSAAASILLPGARIQQPLASSFHRSRRKAASSEKPSPRSQNPSFRRQRSAAHGKQLSTWSRNPTASSQQSSSSGQQSAASSLLPGAGTQQPAASRFLSQPAVSSQQQAALYPEPERNTQ